MKLSVLDQAPVSRGSDATQTLNNTLKLAKTTEELGYTRYWVAEHHNTNGLASTAPEILVTRIAAHTKRIRVGTGGVLLSQYSPFKVAESLKTIEAFFPDRIDLGIGRSPGGSQLTRMAIMDNLERSMREFPRQLADLQGFLHNTLPKDHPFRMVKAAPRLEHVPPLWVLGLSERGAKNAAGLGTGFVFGHFIKPDNGEQIMQTYRENFQPSPSMESPQTIVCIFVVCAETLEKAEEFALSQDKWLLSVGKGADTKVPSVQEVKKKTFSQEELRQIRKNRARTIIGNPDMVRRELESLSHQYQTEEFMIITNIYDFDAKVHSYRLLAEALELDASH